MLTLRYDADADALYAAFKRIAPGEARRQRLLTDKTIVDLDAAGEPIGVELLWVSEGVNLVGAPRAAEIAAALKALAAAAASISLGAVDLSEAVRS